MANSTDPFAESVHGTNPQYLIEKITRLKIYNCDYWKAECFGLTSQTIIDKAVDLKYCGGVYGGNLKPTNFLCLTLKMLQLQPEKDIVLAFIQNEDFKYLRVLGCLYMRLIGKTVDIYKYLEPLYNDYRKISYRTSSGWSLKHMDEFIDSLLHDELVFDIALPHLQKRIKLEDLNILQPRKSALDVEFLNLKSNIAVSFDDDEDTQSDPSLLNESIIKSNEHEKNKTSTENNSTIIKRKESTDIDTTKRFSKLFKKASTSSLAQVSLDSSCNNKAVEEFSVEYWNQRRQALGLKNLKP